VATDFNILRRRLEADRKHLTEHLKTSIDASDEAPAEKIRLMEQRLVEVEQALHKFEVGTYGLCDNCGQPIAPERLEVLPEANLCFSCKSRLGKNGKR
jgi:RNA polymerase-binding transcription factor DksA